MQYDNVKGVVLTPTALEQLLELQERNNSNIADHLLAIDELFEFVFNSPNNPGPSPEKVLDLMYNIRALKSVLANLQAPKQ